MGLCQSISSLNFAKNPAHQHDPFARHLLLKSHQLFSPFSLRFSTHAAVAADFFMLFMTLINFAGRIYVNLAACDGILIA